MLYLRAYKLQIKYNNKYFTTIDQLNYLKNIILIYLREKNKIRKYVNTQKKKAKYASVYSVHIIIQGVFVYKYFFQ